MTLAHERKPKLMSRVVSVEFLVVSALRVTGWATYTCRGFRDSKWRSRVSGAGF